MGSYTPADIRNVALVGHGAVGKTSLAEAMLHLSGASNRLGSVDEKTSHIDFDEEEKERQYSIDSAVIHLTHNDRQLHIVDCPGYPDFMGQPIAAMSAVETAVIVIGAASGIEVNTRRMFAEAQTRGLGKMIVINKMDADNIQFEDLLAAIKESFGTGCVLMNVPQGHGSDFKGVVSVLAADSAGDDALVDLGSAHSQLMDAIVEADEELMERYLDGQEIGPEELAPTMAKAIAEGTLIPILCTGARREIGVGELMDALADFAPSPESGLQRTALQGDGEDAQQVALEPAGDGALVAQVFKLLTDDFVGKLSFLRLFQGKLASDSSLYNVRSGKSSRTGQLFRPQGKEMENCDGAVAGDIVVVAKVEDLELGDTIGPAGAKLLMPELVFPKPMTALAVEPKSRGDEQKISGSLSRVQEEDRTFICNRDPQTHELVMTGMSQLHLDVVQSRLKQRFKLEIVTKEPKVPYRETITHEAEGHYRHKKQTGGRGQFGEVYLRVKPQERDAGFEFSNDIFGGSIPSQFVPAVEKGVREALEKGVLAGYPIQDVLASVYDGKHHPVDSSEAAFKIAGNRAFREAFMAAKPMLLEPIVKVEISIPSEFMGDITGDLNGRRGRIQGMDSLPGGIQVILAQVPLGEVLRYATELRSMTGGQGSFTMEFSHYDTVPGNVQQQIVAKAAKVADQDED